MAIGGFSKSRTSQTPKRSAKRLAVRRALLETLESRQLLAVGPQLVGIQPDSGAVLRSGDILQESPRELVFRFSGNEGIDPSTLGAIRVIRSGDDGLFDRASAATDLGSNGQTLIEFYAREAGAAGNGIEIRFTTAVRSDSRLPVVRVMGRVVDVEMNVNPVLETRVEDLLRVFDPATSTSPAVNLVYAQRLRGSQTLPVGRLVDTTRPLVLGGANAASGASNFNLGNTFEVRFVARETGSAGAGITINFSANDPGVARPPVISVNGRAINVLLNSNPRHATTAREFVDAFNASSAFSLVEAQLVSGAGATRIASTTNTTFSPVTLTGVSDIEIVPGYIGLGDTNREVIMRFAEALPDDRYRIEILGQGVRTLLDTAGRPFNAGVSRSIAFELNLGAQIVSVVPQPVTRDPVTRAISWTRTADIDLFFNNDKLIDVSKVVSVNGLSIAQLTAQRGGVLYFQNSDTIVFRDGSSAGVLNPAFYQLINSNGTLTTADDGPVVNPALVQYYPNANRVTLRFTRDLDQYTSGAIGELRLRVGTNESRPLPPLQVDAMATDPGDTFGTAMDLGATWMPGGGTSQSVIVSSEIRNTTPFLLDFPGGSDEPGNRRIRMQDNLRLGADSVDGTSVFYYNFKGQLQSRFGTFLNAITELQKTRVREVLSLYERYLGVRFIESADKGLTIAVGDLRAVNPFPDIPGAPANEFGATEPNGPGFTAFEAGTLQSGQLATVLDSQDFSSSLVNNFGGTFTRAAMQAIGRLIGLGDADELEQLTIQSFASVFAPGVGTEMVFPGDGDIVHGQFLYRPDSKDIDLYNFRLPVAGRMTIETFAERMSSASLLDTHIRLYQQTASGWEEIAANDDYYSNDSFLQLDLAAGNYIVGVSASGNARYNPLIPDSGIGGRSQGMYQLRMDFTPPAPSVMRDADSAVGTPIDGNGDGKPGGVFDFWFRPSSPANTKFVDKATPVNGGNGSITAPFRNIGAAIAAAQPGDVIRVLGNGGADGDFSTQSDNLAYEIGFSSLGTPLADGTSLDVPKDVTLMIDAGAILKLRRARIGVGSSSVSVDRSGGALLVLGTPTLQTADGRVLTDAAGNPISGSVIMTSLHEAGVGRTTSNVVGVTPAAGDWGGIDFRNMVDVANSRNRLEGAGIFLNYVSHADIRYGGGQVVVDGVSQVITPIQMVDARPTIVHNSITVSADAAMSATPNSFLESNFHSPAEQGSGAPFTVDYNRVGPSIQGNRVVRNSINGLQVRVTTRPGTQLERLTVPGRFDDTDIVHFIPENLEIQGTPGGAIETTVNGVTRVNNRLDARLVIDPGTIIKSQGARIDVAFGSQLIAEGADGRPVVFTSLNDTRYGFGGTFDTANRAGRPGSQAAPGDWGGIYVGHTSSASLDHVVMAHGGGTTRIQGGFADFSVLEVHQADVRLTRSRLELNADGFATSTTPDRGGRATNSAGTIFVRGAQPIIVDNVIRDNAAVAMTFNVSALNSGIVQDTGRSRGFLEVLSDDLSNRGPLVRGNRMQGNGINGLEVRPGTLTTEGIWDDTDIVHVVLGEIVVPDFHTYGGLRLESSPTESLVVKFQGGSAGLTATGNFLDNADRIGGAIQLIGQPGLPVVLTSLNDNSVGAGFTVDGRHQTGGNGTPAPGDWRSVLLNPASNDRNVQVVRENESLQQANRNNTPSTAQFLGGLAPNEYSGDENRRLGFIVNGEISAPNDVDVYSFEAIAGTQVWLDIDRTSHSLDSIVELIDANGRMLAMSVNSLAEEADPSLLQRAAEIPVESVNPLRLSPPELYLQSASGAPKDLYSTNPRDAGFRVSLPGPPGTSNLYHVRVRSDGLTSGVYQLQVRLSEVDEIPGSSIHYADIRFARSGVQLVGVPMNSPLLGENSETAANNNTFANAQQLGNLLRTNRQAISVAGNLDSPTDVDWFRFTIQYERIRPTSIRQYFATVFDVDYADGLGRPDVSLYVFNSAGNLILVSNSSNLVDDQASPLGGAGSADLSRGSAGVLDPYVDSYELPSGEYFVAVTNSSQIPQVLRQFTDANTTNPLVRLQPIEGVRLIAEDHVDFMGGSTAFAPIVPQLFTEESQVPWTLSDVVLYVSRDAGGATDIYTVNPFTGQVSINFDNRQPFDVEDIAFRPNGELRAFNRAITPPLAGDLDDQISYIQIDTGTGGFSVTGATGLQTFHREFDTATPPNPVVADSNDAVNPEAITFAAFPDRERGFFVGSRPTPFGSQPQYFRTPPSPLPNVGSARPGPSYFANVLYEFDVNTGAAVGTPRTDLQQFTGAGTSITELAYIETRNTTGAQATRLVATEVTTTAAGNMQRLIRDRDTFTLFNPAGPPFNLVFEFDLGPEALVNYDPINGLGVRDGMRFTIQGVNYEFDTGSVLLLNASNGSQLSDGATVTIRNASGVESVFEFDSNNTLTNASHVRVPFTTTSTQAQLIQSLVAVINLSGVGVRAEHVPGTNRISFVGASATEPVTITGSGLAIQGAPGVGAGATRIAVSEAASVSQFVAAIGRAMPNNIEVSYESGRINFSGATSANFGDLESSGIFIDQLSQGSSPFNTVVRVLASDTAATVASRIAAAVNNLGIAGISANASSGTVQLFGAAVANAGPLKAAGVAPGGIVTGIAVLGNTLYAVSDAGGLYRVDNPTFAQGTVNGYVTTSSDLLGIQFSGLVAGPAEARVTGSSQQLLFGISRQGVIYAFNTRGELQPVFANGASSIQTNLAGANGLALSTLQRNLWTTTNPADNTNRENDPGHGLPATPNDSRPAVEGGSSWYFGDPMAVNYNFPGGAAGALESVPFSLAGLSAADLPTLYFNYFSATENVNGVEPRDAFRVYASSDDGNWILLATNNTDVERELAISSQVQPLFDQAAGVTSGWRQARVPLDRLAGQANVKLRFEFSTGAGFGYGRQGGRGPEMRIIAGDRLIDGQTLSINGRLFEIEMGPTLAVPGGASIANGESLIVDGIRYVFTDGSLTVAAPDVAVPFTATQTPAEVAVSLQAAMAGAAAFMPVRSGLVFGESNDVIGRANLIDTAGGSVRIIGTGEIGDRLLNPNQDVDMVRIEVRQGANLTVQALPSAVGSALDSYLRIFDSVGRQITAAASSSGGDSRVTLTNLAEGTYYIGVSGAGNQLYNPVVPGLTASGSVGAYQLEITIVNPLTPIVSSNRVQLQGAGIVKLGEGSALRLQGATGTIGEPIRVNINMSRAQVTAAVQAAIANYFAGGRISAYPSRGGDTIDLTGLTVNNAGPFGLTTSFQGDVFTTFNSPVRAQGNNFEGVYLDDFIIGLASRGEMVVGGTGGNTTFVSNPNAPGGILTGPYQFEIRGGEEYGRPTTDGFLLQNSFSLTERTGRGLAIRFRGAAELIAGTTFSVGDGARVVTFELDDVNDGVGVTPGNVALPFNSMVINPVTGGLSAESANVIAARFRDLLNSPAVQERLSVTANLNNNDRFGATSNTVVLIGQATVDVPGSVGDKLVSSRTDGQNRQRPQGQVVINGLRVSDSAEFGVSVLPAPRDAATGVPVTGVPRNTITLNSEALTPGAVIMNSQFVGNAGGGIRVEGDAQLQANGVLWNGVRSFVRLVNNTIVNGTVTEGADGVTYSPAGTGVSVTNNATATLLNNVIVNSSVGINVSASSGSTVIGGTVFHRNTANVAGVATTGQFPIVANNSAVLFQNIAARNLYPAANSPVIDSSIDSLEDRLSLVAVKEPLGLAPSPILAPALDINGQLRVDDPAVESPAGLGERVFKDRGAQDRADFSGPTVVLINPVDNDFGGLDGNPAETVVELTATTLRFFDIRLLDGIEPSDPSRGTGVDDATVSSSTVQLYGPKIDNNGVRRQNHPLVEGIDYTFGYDSTNGIIRLTPLAGIWEREAVYTIRFINSPTNAFEVPVNGADGQQFRIVDSTNNTTTFELEYGYLVQVPDLAGVDPATLDGLTFTVDDGSRRFTFEMDLDGTVTNGNRRVDISNATSPQAVARVIETAIRGAQMNLTINEVGVGLLQIQGSRLVQFLPENSGLQVTGRTGVQTAFGIQIPLRAGVPFGLEDGSTFTLARAGGTPVRFELDTNGTLLPDTIPVRFAPGANAATVGAALVAAINNAALGLTPSYVGGGLVTLGGDAETVFNPGDSVLAQAGVAGQAAALPISLNAAQTVDLAAVLKAAIDGRNLPGVVVTQFGNRLVVEGAASVSGVGARVIGAIRDLAGNSLKANQPDGNTTLTIFLGEGLDYGDAPAPYISLAADGGPAHRVVPGLSLGATVTVDPDARLDDADQDDGFVVVSGFFAGFASTVQIPVTNTTGSTAYVSMWVDFNGDGVFSPTENRLLGQAVTPGLNTYTFSVPSSARLGETFVRIRLSTDRDSVLSPTGTIAPDGEVEDHAIRIRSNPFNNPNNSMDVNGDGFVSPIDILQIINWLNDPNRPKQLTLNDATGQPPFIDVNNDQLVTPLDILHVVNFLNAQAAGGGEGEAAADGLAHLDSAGIFDATSAETLVLASDWAAGLEMALIPRRSESGVTTSGARNSLASANDLALLSGAEDESGLFADLSQVRVDAGDRFWMELARGEEEGQEDVDGLLEDLLS
jgi:hypothetical protein